MPAPPLPADVLALLARVLPSIGHIECLLLLFRTQPQRWRVADAATELRLTPLVAAAAMADLGDSGLVARIGDEEDPEYAYNPSSDDGAVAGLLEAYNRRPVTLMNALYSRQSSAARAFADAFRLR